MRSTLTRGLVALLACEFIALKLFASGFLLRRVETHERSLTSWSDDDDDARANTVDKVVILIVDGARYDWTTEKFGVGSNGDATTGRLRSVRALGSMCDVNGNASDGTKKRGRGKVFRFIADAPTTTQQRLKGLLTGGLPTFVDASDSFGGTTLREDNLIVSMTSRGKRLAISGDDTWLELFPGANETFTGGCEMFPSLDVKDTSTVDAGVRDHMSRALKQPESWDVLIGHMLGADHVGHTFGATGSHMARKLAENDRDIEMVADAMRADDRYTNAMLFVFGDHGMTDNGDHGGGTPEEVDSFLLAYHPWASKGVTCRSSESEEDESLPQIDFAPTMAAIMGVPTPFGNLGKVNEDVFRLALSADLSSDDGFDWRAAYVRALRANIEQVWNYTHSYGDGATSPFRGDIAARLDSMMETPRSNDSKEHILELLREVADVARVRWTQFGLMSMVLGFGALVAALITHAILAYGPPKECSHMDSAAVLGIAIETTLAIGLWLATSVVFFGGGHTCSFNGLHFAAAFTGFRKFNYYGMGFLLGLETWSGEVLLAAFVPMFAHHLTSFNQFGKQFRDCGHTPAMSLWAKITLCRALVSTCAALCAALHRRHLMVWAIFAPKFVFDAVGASVGNALTILSIFLFTGFTGRTGKYDKFD
ncbi:glycosylphosphatidylinositol anchor synthesis protein [Ostreococcus tauri]|uniref:Glycosylphosphatidylinositol anchor synthesis protein n=1 Tax=Ostreococcus tauri TaxID=70448 RepID=A0A1Y5ICX1_OSTTA|nr:glycosylphosphatidylinositol anchor synthesis protein [Ostreococcus tauri]